MQHTLLFERTEGATGFDAGVAVSGATDAVEAFIAEMQALQDRFTILPLRKNASEVSTRMMALGGDEIAAIDPPPPRAIGPMRRVTSLQRTYAVAGEHALLDIIDSHIAETEPLHALKGRLIRTRNVPYSGFGAGEIGRVLKVHGPDPVYLDVIMATSNDIVTVQALGPDEYDVITEDELYDCFGETAS